VNKAAKDEMNKKTGIKTNRDSMSESYYPEGTVILSTLKMIVQPGRRSDFLETMRGMLEPARVEMGCLSYRLYEDVENRNAFVLLEEWATQKDLERHIRTDNQRRLLALMDLLSEQPELRFNTVSHTAGMDLIEDVLLSAPRSKGEGYAI
jgi:quinol monooxygenase YgiN